MKSRELQLRYVVVGGFNTLFGLGLFAVLDFTSSRYIGHYLVLTITAPISIVVSHMTQRHLIWRSRAPHLHELARFSSVYIVTYVVNLALLFIAHGGFGAPVIPAQIAITGALLLGTFVVHRVWTFAPHRI